MIIMNSEKVPGFGIKWIRVFVRCCVFWVSVLTPELLMPHLSTGDDNNFFVELL